MNSSFIYAVSKGEEESVKWFNNWMAEVKRAVPKDRLLVFNVNDGWEPLCNFLDVPIPDQPFPRVNDTKEIQQSMKMMYAKAYLFVYGMPLSMGLGMLCFLRYTNILK